MPAYLVSIFPERCVKCGMIATLKLYNARNALIGHYCTVHGPAACERHKAEFDRREITNADSG